MKRISRALPCDAPVTIPFARALAAAGLAVEGIDRRAQARSIFDALDVAEGGLPAPWATSSVPPARFPLRA